jgi:DNA-binding PadR family transcriptional regulator
MFNRELKKGSPELLILALLEEEERHGYEIGKLIESRSGGQLRFRIGSLYPVLCRLEDKALIKGRWVESSGGPRRRYYKLTTKGRKLACSRTEHMGGLRGCSKPGDWSPQCLTGVGMSGITFASSMPNRRRRRRP